MNLKGSLARLQRSGADFYRNLAQLFDSNQVVREIWIEMAQDMELQVSSLENLPQSFWKMLREEAEPSLRAEHFSRHQVVDSQENRSLQACFAAMLEIEEPLILRAYVPLIRRLRTQFSDQALEFYIIVKAHVARLSRLIQPFAGDAGLLLRIGNLQEQFEHEVQAPAVPPIPKKAAAAGKKAVAASSPPRAKKAHGLRKLAKSSRAARRTLPLAERAKRVSKLAKNVVGKLEAPHRRVRR